MTKPRKSRHKGPPGWYIPPTEPISERYQTEVDSSTSRLERAYRRAEARVASARAKAEQLTTAGGSRPRVATSWREVEKREAELLAIARLMQPTNIAPARHRGTKSFQPAMKGQS